MRKKSIGNEGEKIALKYYENQGYLLINKNFTIRGGELDLILEKNRKIVFVEVKVVNYIEDISNYITKNKLKFLQKTINYFIQMYEIDKDYRLDIIFIKNNKISNHYENIEI